MSAPDAPQILGVPIEQLRGRLARDGIEPYRADQIAAWLYARGVWEFERMSDLSSELRARLARSWRSRALELASVERSGDGTVKGLLRATDGARVEAVLIPEDDRTTLCLSTQVGCPLRCSFCATGSLGFTRNLSSAEIVDQVCRMRSLLEGGRSLTNVVFMGMGEPLLNLKAVLDAIRILMHPKGFGFAGRRITVSSVGVVPKFGELLEQARVNLAVSLHATTDALRDELVPINRRFPLAVLFDTLRGLEVVTPRWPVFFEYTLIGGVNDGPEDAARLVRLLRRLPSKLNLIPMNPHPGSPYRAPAPAQVERFLARVSGRGFPVTLRRSRGADIAAACGQLVAGGAQGRRERRAGVGSR
ncbi:MAG: 23S rRNA (adenine(2503)-C(2))-methyltransferase RlmN [Deltaproteobacteria bacterium]|nr:MAG: 23S rRNA (adenine(2503)-C(2))-methyltransferase RlmN [Deltaproteobacteria bacterium]